MKSKNQIIHKSKQENNNNNGQKANPYQVCFICYFSHESQMVIRFFVAAAVPQHKNTQLFLFGQARCLVQWRRYEDSVHAGPTLSIQREHVSAQREKI